MKEEARYSNFMDGNKIPVHDPIKRRDHMEPAYWESYPGVTGELDRTILRSTGQSGPKEIVTVSLDGIWLDEKRLNPGTARWIAVRLIEAAAIYEMKCHEVGGRED